MITVAGSFMFKVACIDCSSKYWYRFLDGLNYFPPCVDIVSNHTVIVYDQEVCRGMLLEPILRYYSNAGLEDRKTTSIML
jgi:hypothetical protein